MSHDIVDWEYMSDVGILAVQTMEECFCATPSYLQRR